MTEKHQIVKKYIEDNPDAEASVVAENCGVALKQIKKWVREGQLEFADDALVGLECERCGRQIHNGKYCKECAGGLEMAMKTGFWMDVPAPSGRLL
jgi:hypothetical protein